MRVSLIFVIIVSLCNLLCLLLLMYYFEEFLIHDSTGFVILKNN